MGELAFTLSEILALGSALAAVVLWSWRREQVIHARLNRVRDDLSQHKLFVAQQYVSTESLVRTEEKLIDAINGLAAKIDRIIERR